MRKCGVFVVIYLLFNNCVDSDEDWVVKIKGDENIARQIAKENRLDFVKKVVHLDDIYHYREKALSKRTKRSVTINTELLKNNSNILWVEHQKILRRSKRSLISSNDKSMKNMFNDPEWVNQWYLNDARESEYHIKSDFHVIPVWKMNITGRGVIVSIIDDGIEHTHPDLKDNYDPEASTDINDEDDDPMPNLKDGARNDHGTRCASEISMAANNGICGVGIAYNAKVGGIRILDGDVTDLVEALALGFNRNHIDIYSASWGPDDSGKIMQRPGPLTEQTLKEGTIQGRHGKGNIFVWAGGNGGAYQDSCSCDGYASSIYTISINSINEDLTEPHYAERCSAVMGATFSSYGNGFLIAADVHGKCTDQHGGTSAAAPYAAGIIALALEANPKLTWRDVKHLMTWTNAVSLKTRHEFKENNAGFLVSDSFGFGQMDAMKFVETAKTWVTVPPFTSCTLTKNMKSIISNTVSKSITFDGSKCYSEIKFIENIVITMTFQYSERGALFITLASPNGMNTTLLALRNLDHSNKKLEKWPFNTVQNWGENPKGTWTITVEDKKSDKKKRNGFVENISMTFYGSNTVPHHVKESSNRRSYNMNYNKVKNNKRKLQKKR